MVNVRMQEKVERRRRSGIYRNAKLVGKFAIHKWHRHYYRRPKCETRSSHFLIGRVHSARRTTRT